MTTAVLHVATPEDFEIKLLRAGDDFGPRKRLFPRWNLLFEAGDCIRNQETGENMYVARSDQRGALVNRGIGTVRSRAIRQGDEIVRFTNIGSWSPA